MIDAYVDGRPISRSSSSLTSDGLGVAGRRLGGVAVGGDLLGGQRVALGDLRQPALAVVELGVGVVGALDVGLEEAVEGDDLAGGAELGVPAVGGACRRS